MHTYIQSISIGFHMSEPMVIPSNATILAARLLIFYSSLANSHFFQTIQVKTSRKSSLIFFLDGMADANLDFIQCAPNQYHYAFQYCFKTPHITIVFINICMYSVFFRSYDYITWLYKYGKCKMAKVYQQLNCISNGLFCPRSCV